MYGKKTLTVLVAMLLFVAGAFASNERGIDLYRAGLYDAAKLFFTSQTNQSPTLQAENLYYLGQTYFVLGEVDAAADSYKKAETADPEYALSYVGQGQIALENRDTKGAEALFNKAAKIAKKDPQVPLAIASVYINKENFTTATEWIGKARKINKKYSGIYMTEGDMLLKQNKNNLSEVYGRYEMALYFNPEDKLAYLRLADAYKYVRPEIALDYLDKLLEIDPEYIPAYSEIGRINASLGFEIAETPDLTAAEAIQKSAPYFGKALLAYEKFVSIPGVPVEQKGKYAELLNLTQQYQKSMEQINAVLKEDPNNLVMRRLEAYNNFRMENYGLAVDQLTKFVESTPADKLVYRDYQYLAQALMKEKKPAEAVAYFQKAIEIRPENVEMLKELAGAYADMDDYANSVTTYQKFFELKKNPSVVDYLTYGLNSYYGSLYYYRQLTTEELTPEAKATALAEMNKYVDLATEAFTKVVEERPDSYQGHLFRAQVNSFKDNFEHRETGKIPGYAKAYYEGAIPVFEAAGRTKEMIEAYNYLASYYVVKDDSANAIVNYKKILEIDPTNESAKKALDLMKVKY